MRFVRAKLFNICLWHIINLYASFRDIDNLYMSYGFLNKDRVC